MIEVTWCARPLSRKSNELTACFMHEEHWKFLQMILDKRNLLLTKKRAWGRLMPSTIRKKMKGLIRDVICELFKCNHWLYGNFSKWCFVLSKTTIIYMKKFTFNNIPTCNMVYCQAQRRISMFPLYVVMQQTQVLSYIQTLDMEQISKLNGYT